LLCLAPFACFPILGPSVTSGHHTVAAFDSPLAGRANPLGDIADSMSEPLLSGYWA
jgi:hypothetical protein